MAASLFFGCRGREESPEGSTHVEAAPIETSQARPAAVDQEDHDALVEPETETPGDSNAEEQAEPRSTEEPSAATRDLPSELQAAVGHPVECLQDYRPSTPTTVRVSINALVRPSGVVIEPSVSGRGLSYNDRKCIEERVGNVVLAPLDAQASQPVSTYVDLGFQPPEVEEEDVGGPAPKLKDVVEPLPKKKTIPPSGVPIQKAPSDRIEGPKGVPIEGPKGVPVEGPEPTPIEGYEVEEDAERWTD